MTRPRPDIEEDAYQEWARLPDKTNKHAMRSLSQRLGIPIKRLYDWRDRYQWVGRWIQDVHAVAPQTLEAGLATLTEGWPLVTGRLLSIIANGSDKDAANAIRTYAALVGADKQAPLAPKASDRKARLSPEAVEAMKGLPREELWKLAQSTGAEHLNRALEARTARRLASS